MITGQKLDLAKMDKAYYTASGKPKVVSFQELAYLSIEGQGSPDGPAFAESTEALYTVAYGVKFRCKEEGKDFTVAKLEGLWWVDSEAYGLDVPREEWRWRLLIRLPEYVDEGRVRDAKERAAAKKKGLARVHQVEWTRLREGLCVQILHAGPYSEEPKTLRILHDFMEAEGLLWNGPHHEVYLSDPRKITDPARMKTILRQPVRRREEG
uniref:GyrI-like domain-containing protein n=1 Tax=Paenibacillus soyae TaxID=2969249 RepID=A0A9X2N0N9_9BACL|nr:GyrI-like domain-containing protein [Paenibacillus soyae]MCR2806952.1 GyrI-like domain-containing protein [Paenibacillus soyae]